MLSPDQTVLIVLYRVLIYTVLYRSNFYISKKLNFIYFYYLLYLFEIFFIFIIIYLLFHLFSSFYIYFTLQSAFAMSCMRLYQCCWLNDRLNTVSKRLTMMAHITILYTSLNQSINQKFKWTNAKELQSLYINMGRYYMSGNDSEKR